MLPFRAKVSHKVNNKVLMTTLLPRCWEPKTWKPYNTSLKKSLQQGKVVMWSLIPHYYLGGGSPALPALSTPDLPPIASPTSPLPPHHNLWKNSFKIIFERKNFQAKALNRTFQRFIAILSAATLKAMCHQALSKKNIQPYSHAWWIQRALLIDLLKWLSTQPCPWLHALQPLGSMAHSLLRAYAPSKFSLSFAPCKFFDEFLKNVFFSQRMQTACEKGSRHSLHVGPNPSTSHNSIWPGCKFSGQSHLPGRPHNEQLNNVCLQ